MPRKGDSFRKMYPNRNTKMSNDKTETQQEDLPQKGDSLRKIPLNRKTETQTSHLTNLTERLAPERSLIKKNAPRQED